MNDAILVGSSRLRPATISVSGYKHAAVAMIAASVGSRCARVVLRNVPAIDDVLRMSEIIRTLGGRADLDGDTLRLDAEGIVDHRVPVHLSEQIHGALYFLPVLLGRFGRVEIGACGGCCIGDRARSGKRPVEHMTSVLRRFGAEIEEAGNGIRGRTDGLRPCTVDIMDYSERGDILTGPLVSGATKTAILAATVAGAGTTRILHPYPKPDVTELLSLVRQLGFLVRWEHDILEIERTEEVSSADVTLMSDVSEIMTYVAVAGVHRTELMLTGISTAKVMRGLEPELSILREIGVELDFGDDWIRIPAVGRIEPAHIEVTSVGIYSDHQPFFALLLLGASGPSTIRELVWKDRFQYATELRKLGFDLEVDQNCLRIVPSRPTIANQTLSAVDLRGAAALLIAALRAPGRTEVRGIGHLRRGYPRFIESLTELGAEVVRK